MVQRQRIGSYSKREGNKPGKASEKSIFKFFLKSNYIEIKTFHTQNKKIHTHHMIFKKQENWLLFKYFF